MTLPSIIQTLPRGSWLGHELLLNQRAVTALTKNESRDLLKKATEALHNSDPQTAANFLYVGLLLNPTQFLRIVQSDGLLRASRFRYDSKLLHRIVLSLLRPEWGLSPEVTKYLQSVTSLYTIAASVRQEYEELRSWLSQEREVGIRGALGTLDCLCLRRTVEVCQSAPERPSRDSSFFSCEQLGTGFSTILALYFAEFGLLRGNVPINATSAAEGDYLARLASGAHIAEFRDWEYLVDRFGYQIFLESPNVFRVVPCSMEHHRAMELGYIHDYMQRCARSQDWDDENTPSFAQLGREVAQRLGHQCAQFVESPFPRYRFELPEPLFGCLARLQGFTREEIKVVSWTCREMSVSVEDLFAFDFGDGVTMRDLFLVARVVSVMQGIAAKTLLEESQNRQVVLYNSLVPAFRRSILVRLFANVVGEQKAQTIIELLSVSPTKHVDVFYAPLIPAGEMILLPINTFAHANIYRNSLVTTRRRLYEDGQIDPLSHSIATHFEAAGAAVRTHTDYSWLGEVGEIDVLASYDDTLFVLECKNSLLPTGVHELRTSMDYIETAAKQLRRFMGCAKRHEFLRLLSQQTSLPMDSETKIVAGIVVSNRMFVGLRVDGYPVRGSHELENFLDSGIHRIGEHEKCMWLGDRLTVADVRRFFEDDILYQPLWNAMEKVLSIFEFSKCEVVTERWRLNGIELAEQFGFLELRDELMRIIQQHSEISSDSSDEPRYAPENKSQSL